MIRKNLFPTVLLGVCVLGTSSAAWAVSSTKIANNTPKFTSTAKSLGAVIPSTVMEVSIWLRPHNRAELDALVKDLYNPSSPNYRHWLAKSDLLAKFAPTAAEAKSVQDFFASNQLAVVKVGPDNFFVRARGTAAAISSAFHVTLNNYQVNGSTFRANAGDPYVTSAIAPLVGSVYGLDSLAFTHPIAKAMPLASKPGKLPGVSNASSNMMPAASPFNVPCFTGTRTETFTTEGSLPIATYKGNGYTESSYGCGYDPKQIQTAYKLTELYAEGYDGTGQTIVIIDWCGSPSIRADANAFSAQFGLPPLTSANFNIINTAPSYCAAPDGEINLDVEWAHAIAPGAAIDLVVPPTPSFQDTDEAWFYAIDYQLGNVISASYGAEELYVDPTVLFTEELISEISAVLGISSNFSTGDHGDYTFGYPAYNPASVSTPADLPYVTAVGGVSLALTPNNKIAWQSGWGTNISYLAEPGFVFDPPANGAFFDFGSGGGASAFFPKPFFQNQLPGNTRMLPDISWLADPFTGVYIAISEPFTIPEITYQVAGGTSLACPMFSALFAIANQEAGIPLGQAAPYLYNMPSGAITDIVPYGSSKNVVGKVTDSNGTSLYTAADLASPLGGTTTFFSALWDYPLEPGTALLLTFGTDSGLATAVGWDNVTGVGTPNAKAFADAFRP